MRVLFLLLAARSGAGVAGSELLQRREWPRGVVLGLSRGRDHYAVLAAAHGAASAETEPQQRLQAVQHNASGLSGAMRRLAGLCDGADPWARDAQSARVPIAESAWLARSAKAFPAFWALPSSAQCFCCAGGRPRCGAPREGREAPVARSLVNAAARAHRGRCSTIERHGRAICRSPAPNFDYRLPPVIITGGRSFLQTEGFNAAITARDVPNLYLFLPCFRNRGPSSSTNQTSLPTAGRWGHVTPAKGSVSTRESDRLLTGSLSYHGHTDRGGQGSRRGWQGR